MKREEFIKECGKLGAKFTVKHYPIGSLLVVTAPNGKQWVKSRSSHLQVDFYSRKPKELERTFAQAFGRMSFGLEDYKKNR